MSAGVSGDFGRLTGTIAALRRLARLPARVSAIAAPRIEAEAKRSAHAEQDPYARAYAKHKPATVKRWGAHSILDLTGQGLDSIEAKPMAGGGIQLTAGEHMRFAQGGTVNEVARPIFPTSASLPKSWNEILKSSGEQAFREATKGAA